MMDKRVEELESLARDYIGDSGRTPVLYFVSRDGVISTVTTDSHVAKKAASNLGGSKPVIIEKSDEGVWWENAASLRQQREED